MRTGKGTDSIVRRHIANRLKELRTFRGMSQEALGEKLELTFQQIQKYEKAESRVASDTLVLIAGFLGVTPCYFFEGLDLAAAEDAPPPVSPREFELLKAFRAMPNNAQTGALSTMRNLAVVFGAPPANEPAHQMETA